MNTKELRYLIRESIKNLLENIDVPINVGDTVMGGKFKNKKIVVKDIDKNDKGDITINDKPLLRVRTIDETSVKSNEKVDIYRDSSIIVVRPLSERASCKYGAFTKWCISAPSSGAWETNPDAVIVMLLQKNYQISTQKHNLIDRFSYFQDLEDSGEMTPELEEEREELMDNNDYHDFEDLSKIALVFGNNHTEIWDANNINISDNYQFGWERLPVSKDAINAISNYIDNTNLNENYLSKQKIFFHGTQTKLPFKKFDSNLDGSGLVSSGRKYGGFFFTSSIENAEFYTEYFICKVSIQDIKPNKTNSKNSPEVLQQAIRNKEIYTIEDVLDGAVFSNITVVPSSEIHKVNIIEWVFIGDKDFYFSQLNNLFGMEEEYVSQDIIQEFCEMTETNLNFLLTIDIFKEYYESKAKVKEENFN